MYRTYFFMLGFLLAATSLLGNAKGDEKLGAHLIARWPFRGNGNDTSSNGHNLKIENPMWAITSPRPRGLKFGGDCSTVAALPKAIDALNFENRDFTIHVVVQLEENPKPYRTQTLIENFADKNGPGWSFELNENSDREWRWTFHTPSNKAVSFGRPPADMLKKLSRTVSRKDDMTRIFESGKQVAEEKSGSIPKSPNPLLIGRRVGSQLHCCKGVLWYAEIYSCGCTAGQAADIDMAYQAADKDE